MSEPIPPAVVHPPAEPLPDIYECTAFPGTWFCLRCRTYMHPSNVEPHRARHVHADAILALNQTILALATSLEDHELAAIDITITHRLEKLVRAIRARRDYPQHQQDTPNAETQEHARDVR